MGLSSTGFINKKFIASVFLLVMLSAALLYADTSQVLPYNAVLADNVIDLRASSQLRTISNNKPGRVYTAADLKIGSVFINVDNEARKVVSIYENNGRTVIETIEPRPEEVFLDLFIPDFEVNLDRSNVDLSSLAEGVTLLPPEADKKDMLSSKFTAPSKIDKSVTWLETDPTMEGENIYIAFNMDIPLWPSSVSAAVIEGLEAYRDNAIEKDNEKKEEEGETPDSGDSNSLDMGTSGEVRLVGTLRLVNPTVTGGLKKPSITVSWVHDWWIIYHPVFHYKSGYAKAEFTAVQQFDFKLTGTVSLSAELKIPLYAVTVKYGSVELLMGFYAKIGLDGEISLSAEVSEYTKHKVGASCDLEWPFIPVKFSGSQSNYLNFAFRPIVSASAELKAGLYLGASFEIAGISVIEAEGGGGAYISAEGYMEPMGIMGYDTGTGDYPSGIGSYGNFDDWILDLSAEAGAYAEIGAEILTIEIPLYDKKWPFWEWQKDWEW